MNMVIQLKARRSEKPTVRGGRAKNADYRQREYLRDAEVDKLVTAAGVLPGRGCRSPIRLCRQLTHWGRRCARSDGIECRLLLVGQRAVEVIERRSHRSDGLEHDIKPCSNRGEPRGWRARIWRTR